MTNNAVHVPAYLIYEQLIMNNNCSLPVIFTPAQRSRKGPYLSAIVVLIEVIADKDSEEGRQREWLLSQTLHSLSANTH